MKKLFAIILSATVLTAPFAAQAQERHHRGPVVEKKVVITKKSWVKGHRMTPAERRQMAEVRDFRRYRLSAPPRGYHWVRVNNSYLLVGTSSGLVNRVVTVR
jgi:Ni/Co efflux regulator RcnB